MAYERDERLEADARRRQEIADKYAKEEAARRLTLGKIFQEQSKSGFFQLKPPPSPSPTPKKK